MSYDDDELDELAAEDRWQRRRRLQQRHHWHTQDPDYVYEDHEQLPEDDEPVSSDPFNPIEVRHGAGGPAESENASPQEDATAS